MNFLNQNFQVVEDGKEIKVTNVKDHLNVIYKRDNNGLISTVSSFKWVSYVAKALEREVFATEQTVLKTT